MIRNGKIARLPHHVRERLNERLFQGEPGPRLLEWVNNLDGVLCLMLDEFDGAPISKQNLSEWRKGGYKEWLRKREVRHWLENTSDIPSVENQDRVHKLDVMHEQIARVATVELSMMLHDLLADSGASQGGGKPKAGVFDEQKWKRMQSLLHELSRLRRDEQRTLRTKLACSKGKIMDARAALDWVRRDIQDEERELEQRIRDDEDSGEGQESCEDEHDYEETENQAAEVSPDQGDEEAPQAQNVKSVEQNNPRSSVAPAAQSTANPAPVANATRSSPDQSNPVKPLFSHKQSDPMENTAPP